MGNDDSVVPNSSNHWLLLQSLLYTVLVVAIAFSAQIPVLQSVTRYASVNSEDVAILTLVVGYLWYKLGSDDWCVRLGVPSFFFSFTLVTAWIVLTVVVAFVRSPYSVAPNVLWTLKWLEALVLYVVVRDWLSRAVAKRTVSVLLASGYVVAATATLNSVVTDVPRVTSFWRNPNMLAVFLSLIVALGLARTVERIDRDGTVPWVYLGGTAVALLGIGSTGSRSGLICLLTALGVGAILVRDRIDIVQFLPAATVTVVASAVALWFTSRQLFNRFLVGVTLRDGQLVLVGQTASFYSRYRLLLKGLRLAAERPVFGYGWFASPENPAVGILDNLYPQLLVDLGVIGFILMLVFYVLHFREFVPAALDEDFVPGVASTGWFAGMLAGSIGAAYPRVPRLMFLTMLLLGVCAAVRTR